MFAVNGRLKNFSKKSKSIIYDFFLYELLFKPLFVRKHNFP